MDLTLLVLSREYKNLFFFITDIIFVYWTGP